MEAIPEFRMVLVAGLCEARLSGAAPAELRNLGQRSSSTTWVYRKPRESSFSIYAKRADRLLFPRSTTKRAPRRARRRRPSGPPAILISGSTAAAVIEDGANGFLSENDQEAFSERAIAGIKRSRALEKAGFGAQRTLWREAGRTSVRTGPRPLSRDPVRRWRTR